ncbi:MAG: pyridoxamine 5'-phosphate oxidase, partial [Shimia sp.]|nr:pyridoxamine 5'-phosphate oxidase [Shimia sp.]
GSRTELMAKVAKITAAHGPMPKRPPFWGVYRLAPTEIEFWADGAFRLHDRFRWVRQVPESKWEVDRLSP